MVDTPDTGRTPRWAGTTAVAGIACAGSAYMMFTMQDAVVKWLVTDYAVVQLLFIRSVVVVTMCLAPRGWRTVRDALASRASRPLLVRAVVMLGAWLCYYTAARTLGLAELVTLYFVAPLIVAALAGPLLGEPVRRSTWLALAMGFAGIVVITRPTSPSGLGATVLTLTAAGLWAYSTVLARRLARCCSTAVQVLVVNALFLIACGATLPWTWRMPGPQSFALMLMVGLLGGGGQVLLAEGLRRTPVAVASCLEFTGLPWSLVLAFLIWGDRPTTAMLGGVALILASGMLAVARASRPA